MKQIMIIALLAITALLVLGCSSTPAPDNKPQMANPASVNCLDKGGSLQLVDDGSGGQVGMCTLPGGNVCEEWAYMRGDCPAAKDNPESDCTCPEGYVQEGEACNPECYYSEPRCMMPSVQCSVAAEPDCSGGCPMFAPPAPGWCKNGQVVPGKVDECGCQMPPTCENIACTMDARVCPDGSAVGRQGPDCEFAPCPGEE